MGVININNKTYKGDKMNIVNNKVYIDGKLMDDMHDNVKPKSGFFYSLIGRLFSIPELMRVKIEISGDVSIYANNTSVTVIGDVICDSINGFVDCDITCKDFITKESLTCNDISCDNMKCGDLACDDISCESLVVSGQISCSDISATDIEASSIHANGDISCDDIKGDISCDGDVSSNDVSGSVDAKGDVSCNEVGGDVNAGGDISCNDIDGSAYGNEISASSIHNNRSTQM
jgi:hypothetical protein